jgi:hypothetical protein
LCSFTYGTAIKIGTEVGTEFLASKNPQKLEQTLGTEVGTS